MEGAGRAESMREPESRASRMLVNEQSVQRQLPES